MTKAFSSALFALLAFAAVPAATQGKCVGGIGCGGSTIVASDIAKALNCTDAVGTDAWACSPTTCSATLDITTPPVLVTVGTANTGGATFALCGGTAKAVVRAVSASASTALVTGDVIAGQKILLGYSVGNDNWQMASPSAAGGGIIIGTTAITGGTDRRLLYDLAGVATETPNATYFGNELVLDKAGETLQLASGSYAAVGAGTTALFGDQLALFSGGTAAQLGLRSSTDLWIGIGNNPYLKLTTGGAFTIGSSSVTGTTVPLNVDAGGSTGNIANFGNTALGATAVSVNATGFILDAALNLTAATMTAETVGQFRTATSSYTWTNAQVVALGASLTGDITVATLPAKTQVLDAMVVITGQAAGPTTVTVSCGDAVGGTPFTNLVLPGDAKVAANTVYGDAVAERGTSIDTEFFYLPSYTATTLVTCHFISTVQNLDQVTGSTGRVILTTRLLP